MLSPQTFLRAAFATLLCASAVRAEEIILTAKDLAPLFADFRVEQLALSPDGAHIAQVIRAGHTLKLILTEVDQPWVKRSIFIGENDTARGKPDQIVALAKVNALRWATPALLVYAIEVPNGRGRGSRAEVRVVGADGKGDRLLVDGDALAELPPASPPIPRHLRLLPVPTEDPDFIFVAAHGAIDTRPPDTSDPSMESADMQTEVAVTEENGKFSGGLSDVYRVNLHTGKYTPWDEGIFQGNTRVKYRYLYDRHGHMRFSESDRLVRAAMSATNPAGLTSAIPSELGALPKALSAPTELPGDFGMGGSSYTVEPQVFEYRRAPEKSAAWRAWNDSVSKRTGLTLTHRDKDYYGPRSLPLAFGADPHLLYYASNVGRDTFTLHTLDLRTDTHAPLPVESENVDLASPADVFDASALVFDRQHQLKGVRIGGPSTRTHWLDPEIGGIQKHLDAKFPGRCVEVVEWDDARNRFLVLVSGWNDPGRYYVYQKDRVDGLTEFFRRAPWLQTWELPPARAFSFVTAAGVPLSGHITLPRNPRINPCALLVRCPDIPGRQSRTEFDRTSQALARMGFAVAEVSYRGTAGYGARHRDAAKAAFDRVPIEDLRATIDWLATRFPVNRRRVALFGEGFGSYIAARASQLHPDEFRCAVAIDGPVDPQGWLNEGISSNADHLALRRAFFTGDLDSLSLLHEPARFTKPLLIIQLDQGDDPAASWQGGKLARALKQHLRPVEFWSPDDDLLREVDARVKILLRMGQFLNEHVYDYGVKVGEGKPAP